METPSKSISSSENLQLGRFLTLKISGLHGAARQPIQRASRMRKAATERNT
jgi:hypothetical protein